MTVPMLKLTRANTERDPIWINPQHITFIAKGQIAKGDAVVTLHDGSRIDVAEKAKDIVDQMAALP